MARRLGQNARRNLVQAAFEAEKAACTFPRHPITNLIDHENMQAAFGANPKSSLRRQIHEIQK